MFKQILYGLLGIAIGFVMTLKAHKIVDSTGRISWAENLFGPTGTYTFIRLLGIFFIFFFFLYMFGLVGVVYQSIVSLFAKTLGV